MKTLSTPYYRLRNVNFIIKDEYDLLNMKILNIFQVPPSLERSILWEVDK